jgi:hypothetical protein
MLPYDGTRMKASDKLWLKVDIKMQVRRRIRSPKLLDGCGAYRFFAHTHTHTYVERLSQTFPGYKGLLSIRRLAVFAEKNPRE